MNIYEAIFCRMSVRKFRMEPIEEKRLEHLNRFIGMVTKLREEIPYRIEIKCPLLRKETIRGAGKAEAPYYLVFYSQLAEGYLENAGFILEQIVLYLTLKGIGSCYQGSLRLTAGPEAAAEGMVPVIAVAFGLPAESCVRERGREQRRSLSSMVICKEEVGDDVREILKAARVAPSAMNRQPWRLVVYHNRIHVFAKKSLPMFGQLQRIDMGIVLCHIVAAAEEQWLEPKVQRMDSIAEQKMGDYRYTATVWLQPIL